MLRSLSAVIAGVICSGLTFMIVTTIARSIYTRPEGILPDDKEALADYLSSQPTGEKLFLSVSLILSALLASYIAARISDMYKFWIGLIGGFFMVMITVSIFLYLPYDKGYAAINILLVFLVIALGAKLGSKKSIRKAYK